MEVQELKRKADHLRADILKMVYKARSGHLGGAMGMADVMTVLHYKFINDRRDDPQWEDRDRFVLSNGHTCPLLYAILADKGYFPKEELEHLRELGALLQGHPSTAKGTPGVELSSGSLGNGLSFAIGIALSGKIDKKDYRVYCSISDGECQEGQTWEAAMAARHYKLGNLCAILDYNGNQISGRTEDIMDISFIAERWNSFRWNVIEINGHDYDQIINAFEKFEEFHQLEGVPTIVISHNVMGKGISFMEGDYHWHSGPPSKEQFERALKELEWKDN